MTGTWPDISARRQVGARVVYTPRNVSNQCLEKDLCRKEGTGEGNSNVDFLFLTVFLSHTSLLFILPSHTINVHKLLNHSFPTSSLLHALLSPLEAHFLSIQHTLGKLYQYSREGETNLAWVKLLRHKKRAYKVCVSWQVCLCQVWLNLPHKCNSHPFPQEISTKGDGRKKFLL